MDVSKDKKEIKSVWTVGQVVREVDPVIVYRAGKEDEAHLNILEALVAILNRLEKIDKKD